MKAQFINKLVSQPWNISQSHGRSIINHIVSTLLKNERPSQDICGDPLPEMQIVGDIAIIPVCGVLQLNVPDWIKTWGFNLTDINDIEEEFEEALANPAVSMIVIDGDSPGGASLAGDKFFSITEAANKKKPVFTWCNDGADLASSMYEGAAPSTAILTGPFADAVGCIGSYAVVLDDSEYWKNVGYNWMVFRSGDMKGIGEDKPSQSQIDYIQQQVEQCGETFRKNVLKYRTQIDPANMQGQYFRGDVAAGLGFTAGTAKNLDAAIAKFRRMI